MTDFYRWMEENRKRQGELTAIFEKQIEYIANANKRIRELEAENINLKRQKNFLLMHGTSPTCLLCIDCSYLTQLSRPLGGPCDWRCTANLEMRTKCLEKAVERAKRTTGKTADVNAEEAAKE